jgi:1-deoxy-D-xylulose-5-phosphate synthase
VVAIYSTFMQRAVDQVIHDVCLQSLPVTFALDRSGFVSDDGETHQGLFDIALFRAVPNLTLLAPAGEAELAAMLDWSLAAPGPCMIRYPKGACPPDQEAFHRPLEAGRGVWIRGGGSGDTPAKCCLAFTGGLYQQVMEAAEILDALNIPVDCYNLRFLKPVDEAYLTDIMNRYALVVFIEEGVKSFGEYAAELGNRQNCSGEICCLAVGDDFVPQGKRGALLRQAGLDGQGIAERVGVAIKRVVAA